MVTGGNVEWLAGLSPWPTDGFGTERMRALLARLGDPQRAYEAVHVVGTNGKSTAARTIEQLLLADGLSVGSTISPHVRSWSERIRTDGAEVDLEEAVGAVRPAAEQVGATQFEAITAAALTAFARADVDCAVVEAGLGGRHDATNVLRTRVVLLTNVSLDHTDVLGQTGEEIAEEKLAVAHGDSIVVMSDNTYSHLVEGHTIVRGGAHEAAEAFVGHPLPPLEVPALPGRLERRPDEIRDGAHNPAGARWLADRLATEGRFVLCVSVLRDKDADAMLAELAPLGTILVATSSSNERALAADDLAARARPHFETVVVEPEPAAAVAHAHALGGPVLVTGSLYLLADLESSEAVG